MKFFAAIFALVSYAAMAEEAVKPFCDGYQAWAAQITLTMLTNEGYFNGRKSFRARRQYQGHWVQKDRCQTLVRE